jgi:hypothetical protein
MSRLVDPIEATAAAAAADLFVVQMPTRRTLHVLAFLTHRRRELVHVTVTAHPAAAA